MKRRIHLLTLPVLFLLAAFPVESRENNLLVGFSPTLVLFLDKNDDGDTGQFQGLPALGLSVAYRTQFKRMVGLKFELQGFSGPTWINKDVDTSSQAGMPATENFSGGKGATSGLSLMSQILVGPAGGANLLPGLGMTQVWRSAGRVTVKGATQNRSIAVDTRQSFFNAMLGVGCRLGTRDQYALTGMVIGGWDTDSPGKGSYQLQVNLAYAFKLGGS